MTGPFDAYTLPEQPGANAVLRPRALFASPSTVTGLRAGSVVYTGLARTLSVWLYGDPPAGLISPALWSLRGSPPAQIATPGTIVAAGGAPAGHPVPAHVDFDVTTPTGALPGRAPS